MKKIGHYIIVLILICPVSGSAYAAEKGNRQIESISNAKRILMREIYRGHQKTFYCGSQYTQGNYVIHNSGYVPRSRSKRARRLDWEHIVQLESFGTRFSEWSDGHPQCVDSRGRPFKGLNCAQKMNIKFRFMQCDLYNLVLPWCRRPPDRVDRLRGRPRHPQLAIPSRRRHQWSYRDAAPQVRARGAAGLLRAVLA